MSFLYDSLLSLFPQNEFCGSLILKIVKTHLLFFLFFKKVTRLNKSRKSMGERELYEGGQKVQTSSFKINEH